jgi:hypothetical protein
VSLAQSREDFHHEEYDEKISPSQLLCFVWRLSQASHPIKLGLPSA